MLAQSVNHVALDKFYPPTISENPASVSPYCINLSGISQTKAPAFDTKAGAFLLPHGGEKTLMEKGFSDIFLKRYPETIIIPIMQTGAEGKIAFRACIFLPHFSQNGAFLSFIKWCA